MKSRQVCDRLCKLPWKKYNTSVIPNNVPGIYLIAQRIGRKYRHEYLGRSKNIKERLQRHKTQTFKHHQQSKLRMKYVREKRHRSLEGPIMKYLEKKTGYRPVLNKRGGDGCMLRVGRRKVQKPKQSKANRCGTNIHASLLWLKLGLLLCSL